MLKTILVPALGALALAVTPLPALAQQGSPACMRLETQLATLDQGGGANPQQQQAEAAYNQQRAQVDTLTAKSKGMGCGRNFLFGPRPPAECRGLEAQIDKMRDNLERMESQMKRGQGDSGLREARRRDVIAALAQYQCGPQYQAAAPQQQRGGLFGLLFGNRGGGNGLPREEIPVQPEIQQSSTFRTVCVRTCDGFFFPVSFSTVPARFGQDENMCRRTCPGTEAIMFSYPNPGGSIEQATSSSGQNYKDLPNAFKYQTQFVKDCSCKPANMSWSQALANAEDDSVQRGDIVVDEERARAMSQPKGGNVRATPDEAARAAQDSATTVTTDGVVEGPANTDPPAGFSQQGQADPTARTARPYYVPQPAQPREPVYVPPQFR